MFKTVKMLLMARKLNFEEGNIGLFNQPVLICPAFLMTELKHRLQENPMLYEVGRESGFEWFKLMIKEYGLKTQDVVKWGFENLTFGGWGKFELKEVQVLGKRSHTLMPQSTIASMYIKKYGKANFPIDDFIRGLMAGGACIIHNHPTMEMIEKKCVGMGDKYCEIIAMPREELDLTNDFIKKQISKEAVPLKFE